MSLSDEELMLLEQLTYIDENLCNAIGMSEEEFDKISRAKNVGKLVEQFDDHLDELSQIGNIPNYVYHQGNELAVIINEIKSNPKLLDLNIYNTVPFENGDNTMIDKMVFYEGKAGNLPDDAIVCFRGTLGADEWKDNFLLLHEADTPVNKAAMEYVDGIKDEAGNYIKEGLPFKNITVVGHSKGANKAAYCYYESDKVVRCVAMDGPGFTDSYYKKNKGKIDKALTKGNIHSYAVDADFVNILMNKYYGTNTIYCEGYGRKAFFENHCPGSFFHYCYEADGNGYLYRNPDGSLLYYTKQNETMKKLHNFTLFIERYMPKDTKEEMSEYLGNLASLVLGGNFDKDKVVKYILSDKDKVSTLLAYFLVYAYMYGLKGKDIDDLIQNIFKKPLVAGGFDLIIANFRDREVDAAFINVVNWGVKNFGGDDVLKYITIEELDKLIYDTQEKFNAIINTDGMGEVLVDYGESVVTSSSTDAASTGAGMDDEVSVNNKAMSSSGVPTVEFDDSATYTNTDAASYGSEAASNNITIGSGGLSGRKTSAGSAMSNSMFATVDKDTMYVDVAEFERHRKDIYNAADKLIFNAKPAFDKEESICGTESVFLLTDYWHKVIDTTDRFREFKMGPADLLMRNTLKSLLDVDAESAETIKVQGGNSETHTG